MMTKKEAKRMMNENSRVRKSGERYDADTGHLERLDLCPYETLIWAGQGYEVNAHATLWMAEAECLNTWTERVTTLDHIERWEAEGITPAYARLVRESPE